jgi:hypothetical protein
MKRDLLKLRSDSITLLEGVIEQLTDSFNIQVRILNNMKEDSTDTIKSEEIVAAVGFVTKYIYSNNPTIIELESALMDYLVTKNEYSNLTGECMRAIVHMSKLHEAELRRFVDQDNTTEEEVFKEYQSETGWS